MKLMFSLPNFSKIIFFVNSVFSIELFEFFFQNLFSLISLPKIVF